MPRNCFTGASCSQTVKLMFILLFRYVWYRFALPISFIERKRNTFFKWPILYSLQNTSKHKMLIHCFIIDENNIQIKFLYFSVLKIGLFDFHEKNILLRIWFMLSYICHYCWHSWAKRTRILCIQIGHLNLLTLHLKQAFVLSSFA